MNIPSGYDNAIAQEGPEEYPKAEAYIFRCVNAVETTSKTKEDKDGNQTGGNPMVVLDLDIARGPFAGFYTKKFAGDKREEKKWPVKYYQLVTDEQIERYKGMIESFRKSNKAFPAEAFSGAAHDIKKLTGLEIGGVMQDEEYEKRDGSIGCVAKMAYLCSAERVEKGEARLFPKKTLKKAEGQTSNANSDLPF